MISIEPNICTIYVTLKDGRFFDRAGNPIATINLPVQFNNPDDGVELEMSFKPVEHKAAIEAEIAQIKQRQYQMLERKSALLKRLIEIDGQTAAGDARAGKEDGK